MIYSDRPDKYELLLKHAFDSLSSVCRSPKHSEQRILVVIKGAFECILHLCTSILADGGRVMDEDSSASLKRQYGSLASEGFRVLTLVWNAFPPALMTVSSR
jgi:magnesium-transporting ATPase (P-type)